MTQMHLLGFVLEDFLHYISYVVGVRTKYGLMPYHWQDRIGYWGSSMPCNHVIERQALVPGTNAAAVRMTAKG